MSDGSFSVGFPYNYWSEYKWRGWNNKSKQYEDYNIRDEYYVQLKYNNFKQEIMEYHYLTKKQYHAVLTKAILYMDTKTVKSILPSPSNKFRGMATRYGLEQGTKISINHIVSVILYADYTDLSANFTSTFRKDGIFEPLHVTKERNRKHGWWSKFLRETVQIFGTSGCRSHSYSSRGQYIIHDRGSLSGPFYSGMSKIMSIPQFQILLLSPTSTSLHLEVAMKFSGEEGIIIEFSNDAIHESWKTRAFDVSFISRYKEEEERYYFFVLR